MSASNILRDLGNGLALRRATRADTDKLVAFNSMIHSDIGPETPDVRVGEWTRDLLNADHPTFRPEDFTIVEDTANGKIVSSLNLISQTWAYGATPAGSGGIPFGVGRPELVGTLPEYRNRGLVRVQFDLIHQWSAERGELAQVITGIPYYYRIFGYEMGLELSGGRAGYNPHIPKLKDGEPEPYNIRPAGEADIPFLAGLYEQAERRYAVTCLRDEKAWRYELFGATELNVNRTELRIIETPEGIRVGFLGHPGFVWGAMMVAQLYEVVPGTSWAAVTPSVIRYLAKIGEIYPPAIGEKEPFQAFGFWLGSEHPVYQVIPDKLPRIRKPYAFYVRVPDLPAFLRRIAPVLEARLAASTIPGYSGEVKITFYRGGIKLGFEQGKLAVCEAYRPTPVGHAGDAAFPELTFLHLLFGHRSLDELKYAFVDCWTNNDEFALLLNTLFPKQPSHVWPLS